MAESENLPRAGELNRRVALQGVTGSKNEIGERVQVFLYLGKVWAKRQDVSGSESLDDGTIIALQVRRYFIRYRRDVDQGGRELIIEDDGIKWNINYVGVLGSNQFLELKCSRRE